MKKEYRFSTKLIMRIVQLLQEAMMTGTDITELMMAIRVEIADNDEEIVQTAEYDKMVVAHLEQLLAEAKRLSGDKNA